MGTGIKRTLGQTLDAQIVRYSMSHQDFQQARQFLHEYKVRRKEVLRRALMEAAIVAYNRPFSGNGEHMNATGHVQIHLERVLSAKQRKLHQQLVDIRNEAVAHSTYERNEAKRFSHPRRDGLVITQKPFDPHRRGIKPGEFIELCRTLSKACIRGMDRVNTRLCEISAASDASEPAQPPT